MSKPKIDDWVRVEKEFAALSFGDMVTDVAGRALCEFVKGSPWRSVIYSVATDICGWRMSQPDIQAIREGK